MKQPDADTSFNANVRPRNDTKKTRVSPTSPLGFDLRAIAGVALKITRHQPSINDWLCYEVMSVLMVRFYGDKNYKMQTFYLEL
jgi:hypothetical protein